MLRRVLQLCAALAVIGCAREERAGGSADAMVDARDDVTRPSGRDDCHYDCFGRAECRDGVVTVWLHAPVPCEYWTGSCPVADTIECAKGCRIDGVAKYDNRRSEPHTLCEEHRPKRSGDPCASRDECLPTPAVPNDAGGVDNTYLDCDSDAGRCVDVPPPVVVDWLAPCPAAVSGVPAGSYGFVSAPECSLGVCLFVRYDACTAQGCTAPCSADHDCPPGAVCAALNNRNPAPDAAPITAVCKPGPPNVTGVDLRCPSSDDAGVDG